MNQILTRLWRDERGFVMSSELVLIASVAVLALIVGLASYRDAIISEMADNGRAIGAADQSYSVNVSANNQNDPSQGPAITVSGDQVTVTRNLPHVNTTASFNNFSYADAPDSGQNSVISHTSADGANENTAPPNPPLQ